MDKQQILIIILHKMLVLSWITLHVLFLHIRSSLLHLQLKDISMAFIHIDLSSFSGTLNWFECQKIIIPYSFLQRISFRLKCCKENLWLLTLNFWSCKINSNFSESLSTMISIRSFDSLFGGSLINNRLDSFIYHI